MKSTLNWGRLLVGALALPGCYTTTVSSGKPAVPATVAYDEKWHSGVVYGIAELSGPHDLGEVCPNGWSEIKTETSFLNGFVDAVTWGMYNPQNITVRCALPNQPVAAAPPTPAPIPSDLQPPPPAPSEVTEQPATP
jgi:Bor protein